MPSPRASDPRRLTSSEEDYLKALYLLTEWDDEAVRTGTLAIQLGLTPASATSMVQKLAAKGLVDYVPRGDIKLSEAGHRQALRMVRRHRVLETFLRDELGYGWDEVHDEAEALEHTVTDRFIDALDRRLGYPRHDPHGDAIPEADGTLAARQAVRLDHFSGTQARVARVSDEDPDFLRRAQSLGLIPGAVIQLPLPLSPIEASLVWVVPVSAGTA